MSSDSDSEGSPGFRLPKFDKKERKEQEEKRRLEEATLKPVREYLFSKIPEILKECERVDKKKDSHKASLGFLFAYGPHRALLKLLGGIDKLNLL